MACTRCGRAAPDSSRRCASCELTLALPPVRTHGRRIAALTAAAVLAAAGAGAGVLLTRPGAGTGQGPDAPPSADAARLPAAGIAAAPGRVSTGRGRPAGLVEASRGPGRPVALAAGLRGRPGAAGLDALVTRYFAAINRHDYRGYLRLFGPGSGRSLSAAGFRAGYGTTRDSAETLRGMTALGAGEVAATVTFTSRQAPSATPAHAACLRWRITIYLVRQGGQYVIGSPPAGYAAHDRAC
jgi:hypothetical protein